jgi:hypothetical protein
MSLSAEALSTQGLRVVEGLVVLVNLKCLRTRAVIPGQAAPQKSEDLASLKEALGGLTGGQLK